MCAGVHWAPGTLRVRVHSCGRGSTCRTRTENGGQPGRGWGWGREGGGTGRVRKPWEEWKGQALPRVDPERSCWGFRGATGQSPPGPQGPRGSKSAHEGSIWVRTRALALRRGEAGVLPSPWRRGTKDSVGGALSSPRVSALVEKARGSPVEVGAQGMGDACARVSVQPTEGAGVCKDWRTCGCAYAQVAAPDPVFRV